MARKPKTPKSDGALPQLGALVQPPDMGGMPSPDSDMEYHAEQLLHHAAKRTRGYKTAKRKLIAGAKRTMRSQNFQF